MFSYNYISDLGEKNLLTYKYFGTDHSLLYKHVFSPMSQFLVNYIFPPWLAPNLITLMGLAAPLVPHIILWNAFPDSFAGNVSSWMCYIAAIGQFLYIIFDNADGKQARKTGNSTPLGLLFDHGCDAVSTFIAALSLLTVLQFGNTVYSMIAYSAVVITFYMATWEEYFTGHLTLPIVNGPNEGIVAVISVYIISGLFGNHIWLEKTGGVPLNVIVLAGSSIITVSNVLINIYSVKKRTSGKFLEALSDLKMLVFMIVSSFIVSLMSPTDVVSRKARILIYFFGLCFSKLVGCLQLSHVTQDKFAQWKLSIVVPITILNINTLIGYFTGSALIEEDFLIDVLCLVSLIVYIHFAVNVVGKFSKVLGIYVFKTGKKESVKEIKAN